jgi:hypothetical protein
VSDSTHLRLDGARSGVDTPVLLAQWRSRELWTARQFRACWGSSLAEIEDLYDATIAALVEKDEEYESPEHLRAALHRGIKLRALRLHRDREIHEKTLEHAAPAMEAAGQDRAWRESPNARCSRARTTRSSASSQT